MSRNSIFLRNVPFSAVVCLVSLTSSRLPAQSADQTEPPPSPVVVAPVVSQQIHAGQTFVGTVVPEQRAVIGSTVDGRVVEYSIEEGDRVKEGQKLAQLLTETIELERDAAIGELDLRKQELEELQNGTRPEEVEQARAIMEAARAQRVLAERRLERIERLVRVGNAATDDQLDEARAAADNAIAVLEEKQASYELAKAGPRKEQIAQALARVKMQQAVVDRLGDLIEKHTIICRFDGYIVAERTEVGEWVNRGDPVAEIVAIDRVDILAHVLESHVPFIREKMSARIEIQALPGRTFTGTVRVLVPSGDERSRTFPVKVRLENEFDNGDPVLKSGMMARVTLATGALKQATLVPKDAIVLGGPQPMVYVCDPASGGAADLAISRSVPVMLGAAVGTWIEVIGEIQAGQRVVVLGNERLRPGQSVLVTRELPPLEPATE